MITSKSYFNVQGKSEDEPARLSHGLDPWFLLDLVSGAPVPAHLGLRSSPGSRGLGGLEEGLGGGMGAEANLSATRRSSPSPQSMEVPPVCRALAFSQICF